MYRRCYEDLHYIATALVAIVLLVLSPAGLDHPWLFWFVAVLWAFFVGYGIIAEVVHFLFQARHQLYYMTYDSLEPEHSHHLFICAPGMQLSGNQMYAPYIKDLQARGGVWVVNYPGYIFNTADIADNVVLKLKRKIADFDRVTIIGQSMGCPLGLAILDRIKRGEVWPADTDPLSRVDFISVSGFVTEIATRKPVPLWLPYLVRDIPFSRWIYPWAMRKNTEQTPCGAGASQTASDEAYEAFCHFPFAGATAQGRAIGRLPGYPFGHFADVPLCLIETAEEDTVLYKDLARLLLMNVFGVFGSGLIRRRVLGLHAALVEEPNAHRVAILEFIDRELATK